jgi:hypothetical protein
MFQEEIYHSLSIDLKSIRNKLPWINTKCSINSKSYLPQCEVIAQRYEMKVNSSLQEN